MGTPAFFGISNRREYRYRAGVSERRPLFTSEASEGGRITDQTEHLRSTTKAPIVAAVASPGIVRMSERKGRRYFVTLFTDSHLRHFRVPSELTILLPSGSLFRETPLRECCLSLFFQTLATFLPALLCPGPEASDGIIVAALEYRSLRILLALQAIQNRRSARCQNGMRSGC